MSQPPVLPFMATPGPPTSNRLSRSTTPTSPPSNSSQGGPRAVLAALGTGAAKSSMSTYTPCFPPTDVIASRLRRPTSSNSTNTSTSGSHASLKVSYSARLSRSHLALASVSEYIHRPPSPTSAAVDVKRVTLLRRKFRLAINATYRDTSSGKWAHVYEVAKLGSTKGRWQGMCSGRSAPHSHNKPRKQDNQGEWFK